MSETSNRRIVIDPASLRLDTPQQAPVQVNWRKEKRERRKQNRAGTRLKYAYVPRELNSDTPRLAPYRDLVWIVQAQYALDGPKPFKMSNALLKEFGTTRKMKVSGLKVLESYGAVNVQIDARKAPLVTPVPAFWDQYRRQKAE